MTSPAQLAEELKRKLAAVRPSPRESGATGTTRPADLPRMRVADLVRDDLRRQILAGQLREGERLPPESRMIAEFGVGRASLREAYRMLEAEGLIAVIPGSNAGARVTHPSIRQAAEVAGTILSLRGGLLAEVFDAHMEIELIAIRTLASSAEPEVVDRLRALATELDRLAHEGSFGQFVVEMNDLRNFLRLSLGNRTLALLEEIIFVIEARHQARFMAQYQPHGEAARTAAIEAAATVARLSVLIADRAVDAAVALWRAHCEDATRRWLRHAPDEKVAPIS